MKTLQITKNMCTYLENKPWKTNLDSLDFFHKHVKGVVRVGPGPAAGLVLSRAWPS